MPAASLENVPIPQLLERYLKWVQECKRAVNQLRTTIKSNRRHKERCCQVGPTLAEGSLQQLGPGAQRCLRPAVYCLDGQRLSALRVLRCERTAQAQLRLASVVPCSVRQCQFQGRQLLPV